jgi:hypothetical protein
MAYSDFHHTRYLFELLAGNRTTVTRHQLDTLTGQAVDIPALRAVFPSPNTHQRESWSPIAYVAWCGLRNLGRLDILDWRYEGERLIPTVFNAEGSAPEGLTERGLLTLAWALQATYASVAPLSEPCRVLLAQPEAYADAWQSWAALYAGRWGRYHGRAKLETVAEALAGRWVAPEQGLMARAHVPEAVWTTIVAAHPGLRALDDRNAVLAHAPAGRRPSAHPRS